MRLTLIFIALLSTMLLSCNLISNNNQNERIVAQIEGDKLTMTQLEMATPSNINKIDSISFAQNYIEKWVRNHLLLKKAELNLDKKTQDDIEIMIDNYRTSLLLFKYQQLIIQQKLDTVVTEKQLEKYYNQHAGNFRLDSSIVKTIYIQLPKSLHDRYKVRSWIRSSREDDLITLEDYCYQNARNFTLGEDWKYFGAILKNTPRKISNHDYFLQHNKYIETTDSLYAYYIAIQEYKLSNDTTPLVFVKNKIKDILINKRKIKLIEDLENNIYNDAVDQKKFTIYTN